MQYSKIMQALTHIAMGMTELAKGLKITTLAFINQKEKIVWIEERLIPVVPGNLIKFEPKSEPESNEIITSGIAAKLQDNPSRSTAAAVLRGFGVDNPTAKIRSVRK